MMQHRNRAFAAAIALSLGPSLAGCATFGGAAAEGATPNRSLNSVHQPVVETSTYALDLTAGNGGLPLPEQHRLAGWLESLGTGHGDRVTVNSAGLSDAVRADVSAILGRKGLMLSENAALTAAQIAPGSVRVTLTRSSASVPGCPDWRGRSGGNPGNATSANHGCAINGNLAAMVADPRDLLLGVEGTSNTLVMTSNKAIAAYREQTVTGTEGPSQTATSED